MSNKDTIDNSAMLAALIHDANILLTCLKLALATKRWDDVALTLDRLELLLEQATNHYLKEDSNEQERIASLVQSLYRQFAPLADQRKISLCYEISENAESILVDKHLTWHILVNIAHNALKHSHAGSIVSLTIDRNENWLELKTLSLSSRVHKHSTGFGLRIATKLSHILGGELSILPGKLDSQVVTLLRLPAK